MSKIKKKKRFYGPFLQGFFAMPSGALRFTPQVLHQMKGFINSHNPGFLKIAVLVLILETFKS